MSDMDSIRRVVLNTRVGDAVQINFLMTVGNFHCSTVSKQYQIENEEHKQKIIDEVESFILDIRMHRQQLAAKYGYTQKEIIGANQ